MLRSTSTRDTFSSVALFSHILEILPFFREGEEEKRLFLTYIHGAKRICVL